MFYTTGGFAWADNEIGTFGLAGAQSFTHTGWTIGAGLEWALVNNWTVKLEYLFLDFGGKEYFPNTINGLGFNADADVHTIKLGLNYRFGYGKDPYVAARY
jgi:outer membrane immunogenic protein